MTHPELNQPISLDHLARLTDCFGLIQHANYSIPDFRTGYTTDNNARALVVAVKHYRLYGDQLSRDLASLGWRLAWSARAVGLGRGRASAPLRSPPAMPACRAP